MPLTRHLYEMDEVVSALQIGLCKEEGLFWLWELVVSDEPALAHQTLMNLCICDAPLPSQPAAWIELYCRVQAADLLQRTAAMPSCPPLTTKPPTAADAFIASITSPTDLTDSELADFWIRFDAACRQENTVAAIWLLQNICLSVDQRWSAIELSARPPSSIAILRKNSTTRSDPLLDQATATIFLCSSPLTALWQTWSSQLGRRKARVYAIPREALHAETTRGQIESKYTNIADVRDPVGLLSEGCSFWQKTLREYGITYDDATGATIFPDDDVLERFYATCFPDDIPDEWSKQDQEKSHGRGSKKLESVQVATVR